MEEFNAITNNIYLGSLEAASNIEFLEKTKITHVLTVCDVDPFADFEKLPANVYDQFQLSLEDDGNLENEHIQSVLSWMDSIFEKDSKAKVLVHCVMGVNRSPFIVISYLMHSKHWNWKKAFEFVKSKRPGIYPREQFKKRIEKYFADNKHFLHQ